MASMVDGHTGIKRFTDSRATLRFKSDLAESVIRPGAGGFCVKEDEHPYSAVHPFPQTARPLEGHHPSWAAGSSLHLLLGFFPFRWLLFFHTKFAEA